MGASDGYVPVLESDLRELLARLAYLERQATRSTSHQENRQDDQRVILSPWQARAIDPSRRARRRARPR